MHSISAVCIWKPSQGSCPCRRRVTCPLQLLCVIIEPICSAQQGRDGNHGATLWEGRLGGTAPPRQWQEAAATRAALFEKAPSFHKAAPRPTAASAFPKLSALLRFVFVNLFLSSLVSPSPSLPQPPAASVGTVGLIVTRG